jgi:uncharacterized protein YecE (DUF72 family)
MQWYIGTSGWGYKAWENRFYPKGIKPTERIRFYAQHFIAVEINNTFYRLPPKKQITNWEAIVPEGFTFAIKASQYITHRKRLKEPEETLVKFMDLASVQEKGGPILFQLPPRFHMDLERLEEFLQTLPKERRYTIEFRDPTWHTEPVYRLLKRYRVAFCLFEKGNLYSPRLTTTDFLYVRLHGRKEGYRGNYSNAALKDWHDWAEDQGLDTYFFFDNTDEKLYALENALTLQSF